MFDSLACELVERLCTATLFTFYQCRGSFRLRSSRHDAMRRIEPQLGTEVEVATNAGLADAGSGSMLSVSTLV